MTTIQVIKVYIRTIIMHGYKFHIIGIENSHEQEVNTLAANSPPTIQDQDMNTTSECTITRPLSFSMLGDNLDQNVKARYIISDSHQNKSFHFFHLCAVRDRIDFSNLPNHHMIGCLNSPRNRAKQLLPTAADYSTLRKNFVMSLSQLLNDNMEFFKFSFDGVVRFHLEHKHSKEMAAKSNIVSVHTQCSYVTI